MIDVFVYGTLLTGESNHSLVESHVLSVEPGNVYGLLYDAGGYPALVLSEAGGIVAGEWLVVTEEALALMDELEEYYGPDDPRNDYVRMCIQDACIPRSGWVYVWRDARGCPPIKGGSWRTHRQDKQHSKSGPV